MWYKSGALSASRMLNAIYIRGLRGVCGGGAERHKQVLSVLCGSRKPLQPLINHNLVPHESLAYYTNRGF